MPFNISLEGEAALQVKLDKVSRKLMTRDLMGRAALAAEQLVKDHTEKGQDKNGMRMRKYSVQYSDIKRKRGGHFFTGKVNLHDKGHMLSAIHYKAVSATRSEVGFSKPQEALKAVAHQLGERNLPKRVFFGLQRSEKTKVLDLIKQHIHKAINA